jgi:hypothetical protein
MRDRLNLLRTLVPALNDPAKEKSMRSEAVILQKTVEYLNELISQREQLRQAISTTYQQLGMK